MQSVTDSVVQSSFRSGRTEVVDTVRHFTAVLLLHLVLPFPPPKEKLSLVLKGRVWVD